MYLKYNDHSRRGARCPEIEYKIPRLLLGVGNSEEKESDVLNMSCSSRSAVLTAKPLGEILTAFSIGHCRGG